MKKKWAYLKVSSVVPYVLSLLPDKHHKKSDQKKHTGNPYGSHAEIVMPCNRRIPAPMAKSKNDSPVAQGFAQSVLSRVRDKAHKASVPLRCC